ncbi:MAG: biopolymer transporter ExbD [Gammaproteobacteria bacterium]
MKRRRAPISNINVVPYLDVMLVLLVIFMITAPLFNQGVVDLPSVSDAPIEDQQQGAIEIVYESTGVNRFHVYYHEREEETVKMNLPELIDELDAATFFNPEARRKAPLVISADEILQYKEVVELLGRLRKEGYFTIALTAKNEDK